MFDCSISVDGAAAAVITNDKTDINVIGSDLQTDFLPTFERDDNTSWDATTKSAKNAYAQAGLGASDIDVAEIHDAFTIVELVFSDYTKTPVIFKIDFQADEANTVQTLKDRYGQAEVIEIDFGKENIKPQEWALASLAVLAGKDILLSQEMLQAAIDIKFRDNTIRSGTHEFVRRCMNDSGIISEINEKK